MVTDFVERYEAFPVAKQKEMLLSENAKNHLNDLKRFIGVADKIITDNTTTQKKKM